jgi:hypothetical protein
MPNACKKKMTVKMITITVTINDHIVRFLYNHLLNQFLLCATFGSGLLRKQCHDHQMHNPLINKQMMATTNQIVDSLPCQPACNA